MSGLLSNCPARHTVLLVMEVADKQASKKERTMQAQEAGAPPA